MDVESKRILFRTSEGGELVSTRSLANMTAMTWSQLSKRNHIWSLLRLQEGDSTQKVGRCVHIFGLVMEISWISGP